MFIEFVKDHFSGIPKGIIQDVDKNNGTRLVSAGFVKETTKKAYDDYVLGSEKRKEDAVKALEAVKIKEDKAAKKEEDAIRVKVKKNLEDRIVKQAAEQKIVDDAASKARKESEKAAKDKSDEIAKEKEANRITALEQRIQLEEEAKLN
jgi:hypothetical protein